MTLPAPTQSTWTVGEIVTAALMNKNVRDAVNFLTAPPLFVGQQTVAQSIPNNTLTAVTMDTTVVDTYGGHSTSTNTPRYVAQVAGWYLAIGGLSMTANTTGVRKLDLQVNGAAPAFAPSNTDSATSAYRWQVSGLVYCNVGDYINLAETQSSGGALSTSGGMLAVVWGHS